MPIKRRTTKLSENNGNNTLFQRDNEIYFYCDINRCNFMTFNNWLYKMNKDDSIDEIILHISSSGGDVNYAFNMVSLIENSKKPVHGIVDSECHSSALIFFLACKTRKASRCSEFLIHEASYCSDETDLTTTELLQRYTVNMSVEIETKDYFLSKTKMKSKQYDTINKDGIIFYTYDAIKYGIISEII